MSPERPWAPGRVPSRGAWASSHQGARLREGGIGQWPALPHRLWLEGSRRREAAGTPSKVVRRRRHRQRSGPEDDRSLLTHLNLRKVGQSLWTAAARRRFEAGSSLPAAAASRGQESGAKAPHSKGLRSYTAEGLLHNPIDLRRVE